MSTLVIKSITIQKLGSLNYFHCDLNEGINIIDSRHYDEISFAIRIFTNHKENIPPPSYVGEDTRIEATVFLDKTAYYAIVLPKLKTKKLFLNVFDVNGLNATKEYLYLCSHCAEQDLSLFFEYDKKRSILKFLQYANEDLYYAHHQLAKQTGGLSNLKAFRSYLRSYIKNFEGETICDGKQYEIVLKNGIYSVRHKNDLDVSVCLSESEQILFNYLCFLRTMEFWQGFEEMRNLNEIKKPLLIKNFLCRLDEAIDTSYILKRTLELKSQVIII